MTLPLILRRHLFGNPERSNGGISPDGSWLSWLAPLDGVMNIWIAPRDQPNAARPLTSDRDRGIGNYGWTYDSRSLLYSQDRNGDENWHVWAVPVEGGAPRDLTPFEGAQCHIAALSRRHPGEVLVASNARDPRFADLIRVNVATGSSTPAEENPGFAYFVTDEEFTARIAVQRTASGGLELLRREGADWTTWLAFDAEDARTSGPSHLSADGSILYLFDSRGRDTAALMAVPLAGGDAELVAHDERADIGGMISDLTSLRPLAYTVTVEREENVVLDEAIRDDVEFLNDAAIGDWSILSRSDDDKWWTVGANSDVRAGRTFLYDRSAQTLRKLYETRPVLSDAPLSRMRPVTIRSRDGLPLVCYLTIPREADAGGDAPAATTPQALVLNVHGGPWTRDVFGFDGEHQWLANRGYAVLTVNFRGSSGFGKAFLAAGDLEWGARMDDDLSDAVEWAIGEGIADPGRIAIMGGSYGGYATLAALTLHPERYACGVDVVGPSNLETLLDAIPPYWESERANLYRAIGDPRTEAGRKLLQQRSPIHRAGDIRRPLLIGQGANDPRVRQAESDQMVAAMESGGVPVTYVVYPDEGHGFHRPPNRVSFNAIVEAFLSHHLGGKLEPIGHDEVEGASYQLHGDVDWLVRQLPRRDVDGSSGVGEARE